MWGSRRGRACCRPPLAGGARPPEGLRPRDRAGHPGPAGPRVPRLAPRLAAHPGAGCAGARGPLPFRPRRGALRRDAGPGAAHGAPGGAARPHLLGSLLSFVDAPESDDRGGGHELQLGVRHRERSEAAGGAGVGPLRPRARRSRSEARNDSIGSEPIWSRGSSDTDEPGKRGIPGRYA